MGVLMPDVLRPITLQSPGAVAFTALGEEYWTGYLPTTLQAGVFEADQGSELMETGSLELGDILVYLEEGQWPGNNLAYPIRAWGFTWDGQTYRVIRCHKPAASWGKYWKITARRDATLLGGPADASLFVSPTIYEGLVNLRNYLEFAFSADDFIGAFAPNRKAISAPLFCLNTASAQEVENFGQITDAHSNARVWEVQADCWARVGNQPGDATKFLAAIAERLKDIDNKQAIWNKASIRIMAVEMARVGTTLNPDQMAQGLKITFQVESAGVPDPVSGWVLDETEGQIGYYDASFGPWVNPAWTGRRPATIMAEITANAVVQPLVDLGWVTYHTFQLQYGVNYSIRIRVKNNAGLNSTWSASIPVFIP